MNFTGERHLYIFLKNLIVQFRPKELRNTMKSMGEKLSPSQLKEMMKFADTNKDGNIDFEGKTRFSKIA